MQVPHPAPPLHPATEPYVREWLEVSGGHRLYLEQCGNPHGLPVLFLHGGPGSGSSARHRQFFDPRRCRAILFDQRGCGRSLPAGSLADNHTDALLQDIEALRHHLGIEHWLVVGGSWGAGLALAYAGAHPAACLGLVLRGVFLGRSSDIDWFFGGMAQLLPDAWQQLSAQVAGASGTDMLLRLHSDLQSPDDRVALASAIAWEAWEQSVSTRASVAPRSVTLHDADSAPLVCKYRIQSHYLVQHCFRAGNGLLPATDRLAGIPTAIVHGRLDWVCRPQAAWELHQAIAASRLQWVPGCGHNPFEPGNAGALVSAIEHFLTDGDFSGWGQTTPRPAFL